MTGVREGAGEDPFADDSSTESVTTTETQTEDSGPEPAEETDSNQVEGKDTQQPRQQIQIPYKFRRSGVQDGRDRVPLFLRKKTKVAEQDALREFEDRFEENVLLTDLRKALMRVGLQHLDEAEECPEEWGYGVTFDWPGNGVYSSMGAKIDSWQSVTGRIWNPLGGLLTKRTSVASLVARSRGRGVRR